MHMFAVALLSGTALIATPALAQVLGGGGAIGGAVGGVGGSVGGMGNGALNGVPTTTRTGINGAAAGSASTPSTAPVTGAASNATGKAEQSVNRATDTTEAKAQAAQNNATTTLNNTASAKANGSANAAPWVRGPALPARHRARKPPTSRRTLRSMQWVTANSTRNTAEAATNDAESQASRTFERNSLRQPRRPMAPSMVT